MRTGFHIVIVQGGSLRRRTTRHAAEMLHTDKSLIITIDWRNSHLKDQVNGVHKTGLLSPLLKTWSCLCDSVKSGRGRVTRQRDRRNALLQPGHVH